VAEADYDEALTLAAAFLSAGATGVVAARWRVEERVTALFMAMFHRYLNVDRLSPALALRAAQSWMLNPRREIPRGLTAELRDEAEMADGPGGPQLLSPAAWAGFSYQGR
jgi:CHAT domain-containing protein